jgi:hypothetical protein
MAAKKRLPRRQADEISAECISVPRQNLATILGESGTNDVAKLHTEMYIVSGIHSGVVI